jgi:aspartyl-tRNA(Asn)/glutamyl-tRNA(Gln) amidotransferase subunit C
MTQHIDENLVRYIARLSRIELTDEEVSTFTAQLGEILTSVDKLQQLDDLDETAPMAHAVEQTNVLAEDTPAESLDVDAALANAPQRIENFYKVPRVLGEGS